MPDYEDRMYRVGKTKPSLADIEHQLARLKGDLEQMRQRKSGASLVGPLQSRIRDLEATVAAARARQRDRQRRSEQSVPSDTEPVRLTHERYASRRASKPT